ncbi:hypothetical protein AB4212_62525, partial [Streptomyces sp. 2MCAF27]
MSSKKSATAKKARAAKTAKPTSQAKETAQAKGTTEAKGTKAAKAATVTPADEAPSGPRPTRITAAAMLAAAEAVVLVGLGVYVLVMGLT